MKSVEEHIQTKAKSIDALVEPAALFDGQGRVIHANERARALFNPLASHRDLPEGLAEGLDGALEEGRRSFFRCQLNRGPSWCVKTRPKYLDIAQPERPTCALLRLEQKLCRAVPESIAIALHRELSEGCVAIHTFLQDPSLAERYQGDPDFLDGQKRAAEDLYQHALRVSDILLAVVGEFSAEGQTVSVGSLISAADQAQSKLCQRPMQLALQGPDGLMLSTGNLRRLKTLFTEVLTEIRFWSQSARITWAGDGDRLGAPAAKIEISFEHWPHTISYRTSKNEGLGFDVSAEIILDAGGRMEVTPGKPAAIRVWLPLELPEEF